MPSVNAFSDGWAFGSILFGLHLLALGYLIFKSAHILIKSVYISRTLGVLSMLAGLSNLVDNFVNYLFPNYNLNIATYTG